jgi:hypothetical protein
VSDLSTKLATVDKNAAAAGEAADSLDRKLVGIGVAIDAKLADVDSQIGGKIDAAVSKLDSLDQLRSSCAAQEQRLEELLQKQGVEVARQCAEVGGSVAGLKEQLAAVASEMSGERERVTAVAESSERALEEVTGTWSAKLNAVSEEAAVAGASVQKKLGAIGEQLVDCVPQASLETQLGDCVSKENLTAVLEQQQVATRELQSGLALAIKQTVGLLDGRVSAQETWASAFAAEQAERLERAEAWMAEAEEHRLQSSADMEESRMMAEEEAAMREAEAQPFVVKVIQVNIRQKSKKPYVVYLFEIKFRGAAHRFYMRYSTIYDFNVKLRKELKLPKVIVFPVKYGKTLDPQKLEKRRADIDRFFTMLFSWGLRNGVPLLRMSSIQHFLLQVGDLPSPDPTEGTPKLTSLDEAALSQNDMLDAPESSPAGGAKAAATAETAGRAVNSPNSASRREMARELANDSAVLEAAALGMK